MRLVTIDSRDQGGRPGLWLDDGQVLDLAAAPGSLRATSRIPASVVSLLAEGEEGLSRLRRLVAEIAAASPADVDRWRETSVLLPAAGTSLLAPIRRPGLILVTPADEAQPSFRNPNAVSAAGSLVSLPQAPEGWWLRPSVGVVLGRPLFAAQRAQAHAAIAAYTLLLELGQVGQGGFAGGQFPGACPLGPALLTADEMPPLGECRLQLSINGHAVQDGAPFPVGTDPAALIARLSQAWAMRPGDIVALAPPPGMLRPLRVQPGDRLALALDGRLELTATLDQRG
jgi:hypothetical protein